MVGLRLLATADGENIMFQLAEELRESNKAMRAVFDEWDMDTKESLREGARKLLPLARQDSALATQTVVDGIRDKVLPASRKCCSTVTHHLGYVEGLLDNAVNIQRVLRRLAKFPMAKALGAWKDWLQEKEAAREELIRTNAKFLEVKAKWDLWHTEYFFEHWLIYTKGQVKQKKRIAELEGRIDHVQTAARKVNETVTAQAEETVAAVNKLMEELTASTQKQLDEQRATHEREQAESKAAKDLMQFELEYVNDRRVAVAQLYGRRNYLRHYIRLWVEEWMAGFREKNAEAKKVLKDMEFMRDVREKLIVKVRTLKERSGEFGVIFHSWHVWGKCMAFRTYRIKQRQQQWRRRVRTEALRAWGEEAAARRRQKHRVAFCRQRMAEVVLRCAWQRWQYELEVAIECRAVEERMRKEMVKYANRRKLEYSDRRKPKELQREIMRRWLEDMVYRTRDRAEKARRVAVAVGKGTAMRCFWAWHYRAVDRRRCLRERDVHVAHVLSRLRVAQAFARWRLLMELKAETLWIRANRLGKMKRVHLRLYFGALQEAMELAKAENEQEQKAIAHYLKKLQWRALVGWNRRMKFKKKMRRLLAIAQARIVKRFYQKGLRGWRLGVAYYKRKRLLLQRALALARKTVLVKTSDWWHRYAKFKTAVREMVAGVQRAAWGRKVQGCLNEWMVWWYRQRKIVVEAENMFERTLVRCVRNHFRTWHETATWQLEDRQRRWEEGGVALVARIERRAYVAEPLREWRRVTAQLARGRMVADEKWHEMCLDIKIEWFDRWIANAKQQAEERLVMEAQKAQRAKHLIGRIERRMQLSRVYHWHSWARRRVAHRYVCNHFVVRSRAKLQRRAARFWQQWAYARRGRRKGGQNRMMVLLTKSYMDFLGKSFRAWCNLLRLRKIHSIGVRIQTVRLRHLMPPITAMYLGEKQWVGHLRSRADVVNRQKHIDALKSVSVRAEKLLDTLSGASTVSVDTVKTVDRMWTMQQEEVGHILDELVKLLHERNGWKAALKQSQVEMLTIEKKYVAQMRHRLVEMLKESETRLEQRLRTLVSCMADPGFFRSLAADSKKEVLDRASHVVAGHSLPVPMIQGDGVDVVTKQKPRPPGHAPTKQELYEGNRYARSQTMMQDELYKLDTEEKAFDSRIEEAANRELTEADRPPPRPPGRGGASVAPPPLWRMEDAGGLPMDSAFEEPEAPLPSPKAEAPRGRHKVTPLQMSSIPIMGDGLYMEGHPSPHAMQSPHMLQGSGATQILGRGRPDEGVAGMMPLPAPRRAAPHRHPMQRQSSNRTPADLDNNFTVTITPVAAAAK